MIYCNTNEEDWVLLENGSRIHKTAIIYPNVEIGQGCTIGEYVIIGRDNLNLLEIKKENTPTVVGDDVTIDAFSYISSGARIGKKVILFQNTFVGRFSKIGDYTKCHYGAHIYENVEIGSNCKIGGFCCNGVKIGDNCNIYGTLGHRFKKRNDFPKGAPFIGTNVTVGIGSVVLGDVNIENGVYIAANSVITKDIKCNQKVRNVNEIF